MNGIILINKTKGCTSHDIVYKTKKILNEKVGHTGTLDPMATGVLPLLIGKGTLCSKYLINHNKKYQVELQLGIKTNTGDIEGKIIEEKEVPNMILDNNNIITIINSFIGKSKQIPPIYSAIKLNGKKLYEYARKGQNVDIMPRDIEIYDMTLLDTNTDEKIIKFIVSCSKGTYIRSLCEDIAKKLNTVGYMKNLTRLQVGEFKIEDCITIEDLQNRVKNTRFIKQNFIDIETLFKNKDFINLDNRTLNLFLNGVKLEKGYPDGVYKIYNNESFIGTGIIKNKLLKRDIIL